MDLVVDFLSVEGSDEEIVVTELSVVAAGVLQTYHSISLRNPIPPSQNTAICNLLPPP
jgi:hypothetical protein